MCAFCVIGMVPSHLVINLCSLGHKSQKHFSEQTPPKRMQFSDVHTISFQILTRLYIWSNVYKRNPQIDAFAFGLPQVSSSRDCETSAVHACTCLNGSCCSHQIRGACIFSHFALRLRPLATGLAVYSCKFGIVCMAVGQKHTNSESSGQKCPA